MNNRALQDALPTSRDASPDDLLGRFLSVITSRGMDLYPAQEEAILDLFAGRNVILNTPTGSGKSLVAAALHFRSLAAGHRSVYTSPIKALVNEKFLALCRDFGPDRVGMATGDATINRDAPILCCTAEILANHALCSGADAPFDEVVMDEFHYYADRERGVAWQIPLLTMERAQFLLMSATLGATEFFEKEMIK
jgi:superfamily II RNA helicase